MIDEALPAGTRISGYVIERVLGQGGFAFTYLAHDEHLTDAKFALKEFYPLEIARRTQRVQIQPMATRAELYREGLSQFIHEGRALLRLRHAGIVRVHRYLEEHGTAYLVMDYVAGQSLQQALADRPREFWHEASSCSRHNRAGGTAERCQHHNYSHHRSHVQLPVRSHGSGLARRKCTQGAKIRQCVG